MLMATLRKPKGVEAASTQAIVVPRVLSEPETTEHNLDPTVMYTADCSVPKLLPVRVTTVMPAMPPRG